MTQPAPADAPASGQLIHMLFGYMISQAISTAAQLGVADQLKDEPRSVAELAPAVGAQPRALYRLLRALASVGVFSEDPDGRFRMTPLAEPLRSDVPDSQRDFAIYMGSDWHWHIWEGLPYSVREGKPAFEQMHGKAIWEYLPEQPEQARIFNNAMTSLSSAVSTAVVNAYDFSAFKQIVDVGGGHGLLLTTILERNPHLQGVLFDAPRVVAGAQDVIGRVGERCATVGGNFFESVPTGGDAYIMKHIIHDWEDERALTILRHCREAMTEDGRLLVVEMVLPEGNTPSPGKLLDLEMLLFLHSFERTAAEYEDLYARAGFKLTRIVPTQSPYSIIEGVRL